MGGAERRDGAGRSGCGRPAAQSGRNVIGLLTFLAVTSVGAIAALLVRGRADALRVVGAAALAACLLAALALVPGEEIAVGGSRLVGSAWVRTWLIAASGAFLFLHLLGVVTAWQRNLPLVMLSVLGTTAVALALDDPAGAFLTIGAGALLATLGALLVPLTVSAVHIAADGLRVGAVGAGLAVVATGWSDASGAAGASSAASPSGPLAVGLVLMSGALAIRFGAFPLHAPAARLTQTAPLIAAPVLLGWIPAAFAAVALGWDAQRLAGADSPVSSGLVLAFALATIALAGLAAAVQDDVVQVMGYATIQDGAFVLLALVAPAEASAQVRVWLVLFALVRTAGFAFAAALTTAYDTRLIVDLPGWARRSPLLGISLLAIVIATYGWPGILPFEARADVLRSALGPLTPVVMLVALAPLVALGRLAVAGLQQQGPVVRRGFGSRPAPVPYVRSRRIERVGVKRPRASTWRATAAAITTDARDAFAFLRLAWRLNRAPAASALVLLLAVLPLTLAIAGGDLPALAREAVRIRASASVGP